MKRAREEGRAPAGSRAARLVELGAAIVESADDAPASLDRASYDKLIPEIAGVVPATYFLSHRLVPEGEGLGWDFASVWSADGDGERVRDCFRQLLRVRRAALSFDPAAPDRRHANRVVSTRDAAMRGYSPKLGATIDAFGGRAAHQAIRVLVFDGARFLACVGCVRDQAFDEHERAALQALVPSLLQAHRAQRAARERAFLSAGLEIALDAFAQPAFVLDARGVVRHASRSGERWLAREPNARERILAVARAASAEGAAYPLPEGRGALVVIRAAGIEPTIRLRLAQEQWSLTKRQTDVLARLVAGASNKEIANDLRCTEGTVEAHVTQMFRRSECTSRAELTARFWQL